MGKHRLGRVHASIALRGMCCQPYKLGNPFDYIIDYQCENRDRAIEKHQ
jgi:hypothetical protein